MSDSAELESVRRMARNLQFGVCAEDAEATDEGILVEVDLASGEPVLARVSVAYGGDGFGLYVLPEKGDRVVVGLPDGNLDEAIVLRNLDDTRAALPEDDGDEATEPAAPKTKRILLVGGPGHTLRVALSGRMKITVDADVDLESTGTVRVQGATKVELAGTDAALSALNDLVCRGTGCNWGGNHSLSPSTKARAEL